jgi:type II secretory pathway pseudopilin PulG
LSETRREAGFTLVELLVALGLLTAVAFSIAGMFLLGTRSVNGGRTQTVALSVAQDVLEEMDGWVFERLWTAFGFDGSAAAYTVDSRLAAEAAGWQAALDADLSDAWAEIRIESVVDDGGAPPLSAAPAVRVTVTVAWSEGARTRRVRLAAVRT